jgi:hypothetical protein
MIAAMPPVANHVRETTERPGERLLSLLRRPTKRSGPGMDRTVPARSDGRTERAGVAVCDDADARARTVAHRRHEPPPILDYRFTEFLASCLATLRAFASRASPVTIAA